MSSSPRNSRLLRRARRTASLGVVGLIALPLIAFSNDIEVDVDGDLLTARTYASTVGEVIEELDVELGPADEIRPAPDVPIDALEDDTITVERAFPVDVQVEGRTVRRVTGTFTDVADVLAAADLADQAAQGAVEPAPSVAVTAGDQVELELPRSVTVIADGDQQQLTTMADTVGGVLADAGVDLGDDDRVNWDLDAPVLNDVGLRVERVERFEDVEEVELPFETVERETDDLDEGDTEVEEPGREGLRRDVYRVVERDGEEIEREEVDSEVVREPSDRVVLVGTRTPPPPAVSSSSSSGSSSGSSSSGSSSASGSSSSSGSSAASSPPPNADVWDRLAQCESGGNWSIDTGNGYYGGLQFHADTWRRVGGSGLPHEHSRAEQIRRAEILRGGGSYRPHWPGCSRQLGLP